MKILVLGYTGSGKTTAAEILAELLNTRSLNTSDQLIEDFAVSIGTTPKFILEHKPEYREQLFKFGRAKQAIDPLYPQVQQLAVASILTGLRNPNEIEAAREHRLYDMIIWVNRPEIEAGVTDKLNPNHADLIIENNGSIEELREQLKQLLRSRGVNA